MKGRGKEKRQEEGRVERRADDKREKRIEGKEGIEQTRGKRKERRGGGDRSNK